MVAEDFDAVLKGKYPAKAHIQKVVGLLRERIPHTNGFLYLDGRAARLEEDSDESEPFRQRRYFYYLTGCNLSDCHLVYDINAAKSTLFIPPLDQDEVVWSGLPMSPEEALQTYDVDEVRVTTDRAEVLARLASVENSMVYTVPGQFPSKGSPNFNEVNSSVLKGIIDACRVVKDDYEVAMIRKANHISSLGHEAVMRQICHINTEMEAEAIFQGHCIAHGAKKMAYPPVVAAGRAAATLHYEANNRSFDGKQNLLLDAGCEWNNYASDITRIFPLSGTFTKESQEIYNIVSHMQSEALKVIKEGRQWESVHMLAHEIAIDGLIELGILRGTKTDILAAGTSLAFFPHGLGHHLGLETHDVGGNASLENDSKYFRYLRIRGVLPAGSVVTVEPGIYFCEHIIRPYLEDETHKHFIDSGVLEKYWDVGGVRLEDDVLVTPTGIENLTTATKDVSTGGGMLG